MKKHTYRVEYSQITPYIFLGTNLCCGIHFNKIQKLGIEADIDLELIRAHDPAKKLKMFLWLPTKDRTAPTQEQLKAGVAAIDALVKARVKTYVHCRLGHGRSPTLVAAYFVSKGMTVPDAIKKIKLKRPEIHLFAPQLKALKSFAKKVKIS
jgi:protein-tyrosine phosphatase